MVAQSRHGDAALLSELKSMALSIGAEIHERQILALVNRPNASDFLPNISCPVLLLAGTEDVWSPPLQHQEICDLVQNATVQVIKGAGHFLPVAEPEITSRIILDWLQINTKYGSTVLL